MKLHVPAVMAAIMAVPNLAQAQPLDLSGYRIVDLTHAYDDQTLYWPTSPTRFELEQLAYGTTEAGFFYAANSFCTPEHGGTHMDAPVHFAEGHMTVDRVPVDRLVAPAVVIDVAEKAARDRNYRLTPSDVLAFERDFGQIAAGSIVLLHTGWSKFWPDARAYLGDDTPGDATRLSFPSFGADAARLLVEERKIGMLGADVASIDYGPSRDFTAHRIAAAADVPGLENLAHLDQLPPRGATLVALPVKIAGGSGGPVRVIALVPEP